MSDLAAKLRLLIPRLGSDAEVLAAGIAPPILPKAMRRDTPGCTGLASGHDLGKMPLQFAPGTTRTLTSNKTNLLLTKAR